VGYVHVYVGNDMVLRKEQEQTSGTSAHLVSASASITHLGTTTRTNTRLAHAHAH